MGVAASAHAPERAAGGDSSPSSIIILDALSPDTSKGTSDGAALLSMMTSRDMDGVEGDDDRVDGGLGYGYIASEESAPISVWLAQSKCVDMLPSTLASSPSTECVLALLVDLSDPLDVGDALERHAAAAAKFKGATTVVVGCRSESVKTWEVDPDMVQVRLRKYCLGAGAGLVYLSTSTGKNVELFRDYAVYLASFREGSNENVDGANNNAEKSTFGCPPQLVDPDSLFIPAGWDDAGRIKALEHDVGDKEWPARVEGRCWCSARDA